MHKTKHIWKTNARTNAKTAKNKAYDYSDTKQAYTNDWIVSSLPTYHDVIRKYVIQIGPPIWLWIYMESNAKKFCCWFSFYYSFFFFFFVENWCIV